MTLIITRLRTFTRLGATVIYKCACERCAHDEYKTRKEKVYIERRVLRVTIFTGRNKSACSCRLLTKVRSICINIRRTESINERQTYRNVKHAIPLELLLRISTDKLIHSQIHTQREINDQNTQGEKH